MRFAWVAVYQIMRIFLSMLGRIHFHRSVAILGCDSCSYGSRRECTQCVETRPQESSR